MAVANARMPTGPPGRLLVGNLPEFAEDVLGFFTRTARTYGDFVPLRLGPWRAVLLSHPALLEQVLVGENRAYIKHAWFWRHVRGIFGEGLLTSEGDFWLRQRRLAQPAFHRDRIAGYGRVMVDFTEQMLADWRPGETRDVHPAMMHLTMRIVTKVLFDAELREDVEQIDRAFDAALDEVAVRFRRPFRIPDWVPTPGNRRFRNAVAVLDRHVYDIIREHAAESEHGSDLLALLMQARDEDGRAMSEKQLRDESITLFLAGHETTALTLSWTWHLLGTHPHVETKLHEELDSVLGGRAPSIEDLPALRYAEWIIMEAMRLFPPAHTIGRQAIRDVEIGGHAVPKDTTIFMSPWVLHRDPRFWDEPDAFRPDRWANDLERRLPRFAYVPFGGGPRICIGNRFALTESVLILATIARAWRMRPTGPPPSPYPTITLRPEGGVTMRLERRATH